MGRDIECIGVTRLAATKEPILPGNRYSMLNGPTAIWAPLCLPICRDKGNQPRVERLCLDIAGHGTQIDD